MASQTSSAETSQSSSVMPPCSVPEGMGWQSLRPAGSREHAIPHRTECLGGLSSDTCKGSTAPDVAAMLCKCLSNACIRHFHAVGGWVTHNLHRCLVSCAAELGVEQAPDLLLTQYTAFTDPLTPSTIDGSIKCTCQCNLLGFYEFSDLLALLCVCKVSSIHFTFTDAISAGVLQGSE